MKLILSFLIVCSLLINVLGDDFTPTQIHIALAGRNVDGVSDKMTVSWSTIKDTATSKLFYGTVSGDYSNSALGDSSSYYETFHHHVTTDTLLLNTTYYYIVGDDNGGWSDEFQFRSSVGTSVRSFTFASIGDLGVVSGDYTRDYLNQHRNEFDLTIHSGDIGYADDSFLHPGCVLNFCYEQVYDKYMGGIQPLISSSPYMVSPGNHEAECHDPSCLFDRARRTQMSNFTTYNTRFKMPYEASNAKALNMHYSFNYGSAHFIAIDTETGYPGSALETRYVLPCGGFSDQLSWLENDLIQANAQRSVRPWIFVYGHRPMYQGSGINTKFQTAMEDLFYKYGVDMYFSGHVHSYERDLPVYKGAVDANLYNNPKATTHILIGGAGNDEMHGVDSYKQPDQVPVHRDGDSGWRESASLGAWTAMTDNGNHVGIGIVKIIDDSNLVFEYRRTADGYLYDSTTLKRDHSAYTATN